MDGGAQQAAGGRRPRILLAASGSVAAIKLPELARLLAEFADVRLLLTAAARKFVAEADFPPVVLPIYVALLQRYLVPSCIPHAL